MISFESVALSFSCLLLLFMSTDFSFGAQEQVMHLLGILSKFSEFPKQIITAGFSTGLGIVLGNLVIGIVKYRNLIKDVSKVFDLVVNNQIDDLHNIQIACGSIKNRLTTHAGTIIGQKNGSNVIVLGPQRTTEERRGLLKDIAKIKDRESTIRDDDLYKGKLNDVKLFKSNDLKILVRYFRKLKVTLEDIRIFTSYELPISIDEFDTFNWRSSETYKKRTDFLIARINAVICLGLMTKRIFNSFDIKTQEKLSEVYRSLSNIQTEIKNDRSVYSLLREDFDIIQIFLEKEISSKVQPYSNKLI